MAWKSAAYRFVFMIGIVNLFADFTYEGGSSIYGPFLGILGGSGAIIGFVSGFGEFLGFAVRSVSGYLADKTRTYWGLVFVGYAVNLLAVPALALAGNFPLAAFFTIMEPTGRAIRRPIVEAMLSSTTKELGRGRVFGLNEAMDQVGGTIGPLVVALIFYLGGGYRRSFAILLIPAVLSLSTLALTYFTHPQPQKLEKQVTFQGKGFSRAYWTFVAAGALMATGFTGFPLISFHFQQTGTLVGQLIPISYAVAMASAALTSFAFGRLLDWRGYKVVLITISLSAFFSPLVFLGESNLAVVGMVLWGIGIGIQDSLLKAVLTDLISEDKKSTGFGFFDTVFGLFYLLGNVFMGVLYDASLPTVILFSITFQLAAVPVFALANKRGN